MTAENMLSFKANVNIHINLERYSFRRNIFSLCIRIQIDIKLNQFYHAGKFVYSMFKRIPLLLPPETKYHFKQTKKTEKN